MDLRMNVLPHTAPFVGDTTSRYTALVAGVGSGKTIALIQHTILMAALNPGCLGILASPTFGMLEKNILNKRNGLPVHLEEAGIPFDFKGGNTFTLKWPNGQTSEIECTHSGSSISGRTAAFFGIDEVDLLKTSEAADIWDILVARLRDPNAKFVQGYCASTPEGKKWLWQTFEQNLIEKPALADRFKLYRCSTYDNFLLPANFIADLEAQYDPRRVAAHLRGEFVSLNEGLVYADFDRKLNHTDEVIQPNEQLNCGIDFNLHGMSCTISVIRDNQPYLLDEIMGAQDTRNLAELVNARYPNHRKVAWPDATGKDVRSTTSTVSDHTILQQHGFALNTTPANGFVLDRVAAVKAQILNGSGQRRLKVNTHKCPITTACLEQQVFDDAGMPRKGDRYGKMRLFIDGPLDALGYFIVRRWPVARPGQAALRLLGS